jgi:hypothetical protein
MLNVKPHWKLKWDYSGLNKFGPDSPYSQKDWNQTLHTKINQISAQIHMSSLIGPADTITLHPQIYSLFNELEYYNEETKMLSTRYNVIVDKEVPKNTILIYSTEILNLDKIGYLAQEKEGYDVKKAVGRVKIINYGT